MQIMDSQTFLEDLMKKPISNDLTVAIRMPTKLKRLIEQYVKLSDVKSSKFIRDTLVKEVYRLDLIHNKDKDPTE